LERDLPVSTGFNAVHLIGHPIHHSENSGVNRKPVAAPREISCGNNCVGNLRRAVCKLGPPESGLSALVGPLLPSDFSSVGNLGITPDSEYLPLLSRAFGPPWSPSEANKVGIFRNAVANPSPLFCDAPFLFQFPQTVSVGSKAPPAISFVARADMSGFKRSVSPGISSLHNGPDNFAPAFRSDSRGVFKEND